MEEYLNNPVVQEGARRCAAYFTQERFGQHDLTEQERTDVLDFCHGEVVRWLQATGRLEDFSAEDAVVNSVAMVLTRRIPKQFKAYEPSEWTL